MLYIILDLNLYLKVMSLDHTKLFLSGFKFVEGMRWYQDQLWFCDLWDNKVVSFNVDGDRVKEISVDKPIGLGWLSDGSLLIMSLMERKLLRYHNHKLTFYKSLEIAKPGYAHDFVVSQDDAIYISVSGFYPVYGAKPVKSNILVITPNKKLKVAVRDIGYPNGIVITPDGRNLIAAETFSAKILIFDMNQNFTLTKRKTYAKFDNLGFQASFDNNGIPLNKSRHYPDGMCFDKRLNAVWVASPARKEVLCVGESGKIIKNIQTISHPFDCIIGGYNNEKLFIGCSELNESNRTGKIEMFQLN